MFGRYVKHLRGILLGLCASLAVCSFAADVNKPEEAQALVKKAVEQYKTQGRDKTFHDIDKLDGPYVGKEMFCMVYDPQGIVLSHGAFHKLIGVNIMESLDSEGAAPVKRIFEAANKKDGGWAYYKWPNPSSRIPEPKMTFAQRHDNLVFACGVHYSKK